LPVHKEGEVIFTINKKDTTTNARIGTLSLPHGDLLTPAFMPVGTNAAVKAILNADITTLGISLILANAYHLYLRPGMDVIKNAGGLHKFMAWDHNILTDSGGFQVFSLAPFRKIEEKGVYFRSHIDGSYHRLTPVDVVKIQETLGSDILMPLDICTPAGISEKEASVAVKKTFEWAKESIDYVRSGESKIAGYLFAIVQGNLFKSLRDVSSEGLLSLDFPGYAIGGLSVGEPFDVFVDILSHTARNLPEIKPRYLMGVGTPEYILAACENGIDLFDCVFPTRIARNACAFTRYGTLSLRLEKNKFDLGPIDPECSCSVCARYSRSYLRHLFKAREINASVLVTFHNLSFIQNLIISIRSAIFEGRFREFKREFLQKYMSKGIVKKD
jgi:queuine tRNA-ribosyltransferase